MCDEVGKGACAADVCEAGAAITPSISSAGCPEMTVSESGSKIKDQRLQIKVQRSMTIDQRSIISEQKSETKCEQLQCASDEILSLNAHSTLLDKTIHKVGMTKLRPFVPLLLA